MAAPATLDRDEGPALRLPLALSALLHAAAIGAFALVRAPAPVPMPPTYRVSLVAAPPGPRAVGVVQPKPAAEPPAPRPTPPRPVRDETKAAPAPPSRRATAKAAKVPTKSAAKVPPRTAPARSTPTPATKAAEKPKRDEPLPTAGGGPEGGKGADVANVKTEGIDFPYPGYLEKIVREIRLRFDPPKGSAVSADVSFLIHRDGSVSNVRFLKQSASYAFNLEARGAIEAAAKARAFGPLPTGFGDDVLPVIFSFDPRLLR